MDDAGLLPRSSKGLHVYKPSGPETLGFCYCPFENLCVPDTGRKSDGLLSRGISNSVMMEEPQVISEFLSQSTGPLNAGCAFLNTAAKNGNTNRNKTGAHTKKAKVADPSKWKKNKQKQLRMEGKAYVSKRKKDGEFVTKQPRTVGPRCTSTVCKKACNRLCDDISEDDRSILFNKFWLDMNWAQRRQYVAEQVDREPVERSRAAGPQSRRSVSYRYHLLVDGQRKQVCKNMFLSTLGIREWSVLNWAQKGSTEKNKSNEDEVKKMDVPVCQQQNPVSSSLCYTVDLTQEPVTSSEVDKSRPTELEGLTRQKSRVAKPLMWKQNQKRQLRMEGKSYISKRKQDGTTVTKAERKLGLRCSSIACRRASNRFCADFSEEARSQLFTSFWKCMNWTQRKKYVAGLVDCDPVERTRAASTKSRRSLSMRYHLLADGNRRQVCKKMFLSTLGIGEWSVLNWAQNPCQTDESAKKRMQRTSRKASEHIFLKEFLDSLPKVPSLYCGTSTPKLFLEPVFSNMSEVYRCYHNHCMEKKTTPLSRQVFCEVFKKMDLGLCVSKKDQGFGFGAAGDLFNELLEEYCIERGVSGSQLELQTRQKDSKATC